MEEEDGIVTPKKSDLFEIYCSKRDEALNDKTYTNRSLAIALFCIRWHSYTEALLDFGIINENDRKHLLELTQNFP